ncbi:hypothetical protein ACFQ88_38930 [Paenibacillus sp. NPDC056579]|uniref:hypothetical protein n=1 Tax=Paenibacillus sp. NPDC056579 TaxID=3345871 RepID=UPI0036BCB954
MINEHLINELDFVLTHPSCDVTNLESFYNTCLFLYETVPLIVIVNHMHKKKPQLLYEWATKNKTVNHVLADMGVKSEELGKEQQNGIEIKTDIQTLKKRANGYYIFVWDTDIEEEKINSCFKSKTLVVKCNSIGDMELIGFVKTESKKQYNLYLKMKEEKK